MRHGEISTSTDPTFSPIAPKGLGPGGVAFLVLLLLGAGGYVWLRDDPNARDLLSDLRSLDEAEPASAPASPPVAQPPLPTLPSATPPEDGPLQTDEARIRREADKLQSDLETELAEARREADPQDDPKAQAGSSTPLRFLGSPHCAPFGRQWIVSGQVLNPRNRTIPATTATVTLLVDGEPAETREISIGPVGPFSRAVYEVLFRPRRATDSRFVTAEAVWKEPS